jgi:hypothetical protein
VIARIRTARDRFRRASAVWSGEHFYVMGTTGDADTVSLEGAQACLSVGDRVLLFVRLGRDIAHLEIRRLAIGWQR